jgi:hypothetical protein
MQTIISMATYVVMVLLCYGAAYLLNADAVDIIAFVALALAVDSLTRVD